VPTTDRRLLGRDAELAAIVRLLDARDRLPGATVLHGPAGIGKTSLWLAGVAAARERGFRVLSSRPSEAETTFAYAGLADLLGGAVGEALAELPPVQRRALEAALLLGDSVAGSGDRTVAAAFLGALRSLSIDGLVCIAVDDAQWLDAASLAALRHALARLDGEPVATLLAVRGGAPPWLTRTVSEQRRETIEVCGLSLGATHELLRSRLDATFPRPTLIRLWETSGGNPFFALELAGALRRRGGTLGLGEELPIPADLDQLLRERLGALSPAALRVAHVVAAVAEPTADLVEAMLGAEADTGLANALDAGLLELDGGRVRFTHPLLASAVAVRQAPSRRRSLHARLAAVVPTEEERARHLALAAAGPDRDTAAILEDAVRSALERGAPAAAAELAEQAHRLTPPADAVDARRRLVLAAHGYDVAGDTDLAISLLERARDEAPAGVERAAALVQLADVQDDPRAAVPLYRRALAETEGDDALEATIHIRLAGSMTWREGARPGTAHAELAVRAASRTDDVEIRCRALAAQGDWNFRAGHGIVRAQMHDAIALERSLASWPLDRGPSDLFSRQLVYAVELDPARRLLHELLGAHCARNDADGEATATWWLGLLEWRAGSWEKAEQLAADSLDLRRQLGHMMPGDRFPAATIAAHRGAVDDARDGAERDMAAAETMGIRIAVSGMEWVLGFVALSLGDAAAALPHLRRAYELRNAFMLEPGQRLELGDLLEALNAAGELDEAAEIVAAWAPRASRLDRAWALAILGRSEGVLLAARGELDAAFASFERALSEHARSTDPFQHARTLLALGRTQRRAKQRRASRVTLGEALARFETLGAPLWAEQARAELARIGGRVSSGDELTEAERRIAGLVGEGHTNREVAAALFLTEHTVETALTRVYRKLGVRSRTELARRLGAKT